MSSIYIYICQEGININSPSSCGMLLFYLFGDNTIYTKFPVSQGVGALLFLSRQYKQITFLLKKIKWLQRIECNHGSLPHLSGWICLTRDLCIPRICSIGAFVITSRRRTLSAALLGSILGEAASNLQFCLAGRPHQRRKSRICHIYHGAPKDRKAISSNILHTRRK